MVSHTHLLSKYFHSFLNNVISCCSILAFTCPTQITNTSSRSSRFVSFNCFTLHPLFFVLLRIFPTQRHLRDAFYPINVRNSWQYTLLASNRVLLFVGTHRFLFTNNYHCPSPRVTHCKCLWSCTPVSVCTKLLYPMANTVTIFKLKYVCIFYISYSDKMYTKHFHSERVHWSCQTVRERWICNCTNRSGVLLATVCSLF